MQSQDRLARPAEYECDVVRCGIESFEGIVLFVVVLVIIVHIHKAWFTDVLLLAIIATTTTTTTTTTIILLTRVESRLALVAATSQAFDVAREAPGQEEDSEEYRYYYVHLSLSLNVTCIQYKVSL